MNVSCSAEPCPVILNATCVFYQGGNLVYTGILTNDNLQTALEKIDKKFKDAGLGYIFNNGLIQTVPGNPVQLGGSLIQNTIITNNGFNLTFTENLIAGAHVTTGGTSSDFVKGDGSLDGTSYQIAGNYITSLTGDGTASGPGSAVFTLANTGVIPNTYGSASQVPVLTVDSKGRITNVTNTAINYPAQLVSISGDAVGAGLTGTSINLVFNTVNANPYAFITALKFSVNGKGLVTGASPLTNLDIFSIIGYTPLQDAPSNGTTYGRRNGLWVAVSGGGGGGTVTSVAVTSGTGISASVANPTTTPNITITNTAPDQTVVLNNGTGITTSGTYPNFTITNTAPDQTVSLGTTGTGLSITGTYPSFTLQNTLPDQTVALSSGTGISVSGTYPNFTITNTSPSSGGTVTGVTATSPITSSGGTAPVISTSMATNKLIGRSTAGTGVMEEITVGTGLSLSGGTLNATAQAVGFEQNFLLMGA